MKKVSPIMKAHLIRHAFCLLLLLVAVCVTAFALGQRLNAAPSQRTTQQVSFVWAVLLESPGDLDRTCQVPAFAWLASLSTLMDTFMRWAGAAWTASAPISRTRLNIIRDQTLGLSSQRPIPITR